MPKCSEMTELATDYLEGALPWRAKLRARWHLALCSLCRAYFVQIGRTRRLLRGRPLAGAAPDVEARLIDARRTMKPEN